MTQISEQAKAEGRAMTDKELVDKLDAWLFNLRLECSGASRSAIEEIAIGGAVLKLSDLLDVLESLTSELDKWRKLAAEANEALSRCLDHMDEHSSEPAFEAYQAGLAALTAFNTAEGGRQHIKDTDNANR